MAHLIMDHGVSGCFGTRLAPKNEAGTGRKAAPTPPLARRAGSRHWVSILKCDVIESRTDKLLLVSDCCLYFSLELRGDLPNPMLLCVFRGILQHFLFGVAPYDMCASGRWINLGALNDFSHGSSSLLSQDLPISDNCCENLAKCEQTKNKF